MTTKTSSLRSIKTTRNCGCRTGNGLRQCSRTASFRDGNTFLCAQHAIAKFGPEAVASAR